MEQDGDGMPRPRRAVNSRNRSSMSDGSAEDKSDIQHETAKRCQGAKSEKTEGPPYKKNANSSKECSIFNNPERTKHRWSAEEDEVLTQMVNKHGTKNWQTIAGAIPDRNAHACLSRWKYILDPTINKEAWSQQEDLRLIRAHQIYGNKWCKMVKHFPGRTNNALKEHWRGSMKRKLDLYLASGLLEQVPGLYDNLPVPKSNQSDIPKDSEVSVGGSSDFIYAKTLDVQSSKVSKRIMTKLQQRARARKQLYSLSTPVEVKSDVPHEIAKHCQDSESEKTEGPPHKKNVHCLEESSSKNPERTRCRWSAEEDEMLTRMVTKDGLKNWQTIASAIPDRNAQQCRIRWKHSLDPEINKEPWSEQEELTLIRAHQIYGNQWLKMVKHFPGRTNHALKEHWRGPMKGKLNSYLASGLLEQIPDLHEDLSVPDSSQSDIPKDSEGSSYRNLMPPALPKSLKSKQEVTGEGENADSSGGESSDFIYPKGLNAHSANVSERIIAKSKQRARARRKLDFLSTPVELKVCAFAASSQRPPPKSKQMNPDTGNTSPSIVCGDIPPNVPSECVETALSRSANNHPNDIPSSARPEPCSPDIHENSSDHLDMLYCDGLMIDLPSYPHGCSFI